jgi:predicted glycosyltransferase involved in capsule biosynthesis
MDTDAKDEDNSKFLAQNIEIEELVDSDEVSDSDVNNSIEQQNKIDISNLNSRNDKTFRQCSNAGDIYSDEELNEDLQELNGGG